MSPRKFTYNLSLGLLCIGGLVFAWMAVEFLQAKLTVQPASASSLSGYHSDDYPDIAHRPRWPLPDAVIGDAMDDYQTVQARRITIPREKLISGTGELRPLGRQEIEALADPEVEMLVARFIRGARRESISENDDILALGISFFRKIRLATLSARLDLAEGRDEQAWRKAIALTRLPQDMLGRAHVGAAKIAISQQQATFLILSELAGRAKPATAARWLSEVEVLLRDLLPQHHIGPAFLAGEAPTLRTFDRIEREWIDYFSSPAKAAHTLMDRRSSPSEIFDHCNESPGIETVCRMVASGVAEFVLHDRKLRELHQVLVVAAKEGNQR